MVELPLSKCKITPTSLRLGRELKMSCLFGSAQKRSPPRTHSFLALQSSVRLLGNMHGLVGMRN